MATVSRTADIFLLINFNYNQNEKKSGAKNFVRIISYINPQKAD